MKFIIAAVVLLAAALGLWLFLRWRKRRNSPMISLVLLLREPIVIDSAILARIAGRAWNADLGDGTSEGKDGFAVGEEMLLSIMCNGRFYIVHNHSQPYVDDPAEAAQSIPDLRIRELFGEHRAWFSCDFMAAPQDSRPVDVTDCYRQIARLIVEFLDENALLIYDPETSQAWPTNDDTEQALLSDDPREALQESLTVPVTTVADDDPLMKEAVAKARETWPEFVAAFEERTGEDFSIKAPVTAAGNTEFIWIAVTAVEGNQIFGTLANDPVHLGALKLGSKVSVKLADLNDWCYLDRRGEPQGLFTLAAVQKAAKRSSTS